jgi:hypothetical protein
MHTAIGRLAGAEHVRSVWQSFRLERFEEAVGDRVDRCGLNTERITYTMCVWVVRELILSSEVLSLQDLEVSTSKEPT